MCLRRGRCRRGEDEDEYDQHYDDGHYRGSTGVTQLAAVPGILTPRLSFRRGRRPTALSHSVGRLSSPVARPKVVAATRTEEKKPIWLVGGFERGAIWGLAVNYNEAAPSLCNSAILALVSSLPALAEGPYGSAAVESVYGQKHIGLPLLIRHLCSHSSVPGSAWAGGVDNTGTLKYGGKGQRSCTKGTELTCMAWPSGTRRPTRY